jgi:hypothetical protein
LLISFKKEPTTDYQNLRFKKILIEKGGFEHIKSKKRGRNENLIYRETKMTLRKIKL